MMKKSFMLYLITVLLCLLLGSCSQTPAEEDGVSEVSDADTDNKMEGIHQKDVVIRKTKAQYVIY
jgi:PBP1b-binding outer membrane lipoprotein LpoB